MRNIKEGDRVTFYWNEPDGAAQIEGLVQNTPANVGDLWYIEDKSGHTHAINPNHIYLEQIIKLKAPGLELREGE